MKIIQSEEQLFDCFRALDRNEIELSAEVKFPLTVDGFFKWIEPSGARVFLVFEDLNGGLPKGIVFRRSSTGSNDVPEMCTWCHSVRPSGNVRMLTATASSKKRIGIYLCGDLSCREKALGLPNPNDIPDGTAGDEKVAKILERISEFAANGLF